MISAKCVLQSIVARYNNNQMGTHVVKQTLRETNYTTYFALFSSIMHQLTVSLVLNCFSKDKLLKCISVSHNYESTHHK